jgi:hypothetical protein
MWCCRIRAGKYEVDNMVDCRAAARDYHRVPATRGKFMREYLMPILVVATLALAGCNKSKSPEDVSKDVATAEQKARDEVAKSEARAQRALDKSYEKVNDQEIKFNNDAAHQTYNVAIATADGKRKVALATCELQSADAQRACKDQAETDYKTARADAKASAEMAVEQK